jgi:hypothetical protein
LKEKEDVVLIPGLLNLLNKIVDVFDRFSVHLSDDIAVWIPFAAGLPGPA